MNTLRVAGIETEYGIMTTDADSSDSWAASQAILAAYPRPGAIAVPCWDYPALPKTSEMTLSSFQTSEVRAQLQAEQDQQKQPALTREPSNMADLMLANGARLYIDLGHPEYSTPECLSPRQLVLADKAGERILAACQQRANTTNEYRATHNIRIYKNNSDYKNNSYGCHENYLIGAHLFESFLHGQSRKAFHLLCAFLVTRLVFCGSGKVGSENGTRPVGFQLSQRADFFETLIGLQTTSQRPLFNTRDEPHADPTRLRRLHVIVGDANMAEMSTYLKIGTMQLLLSMLEDDVIAEDLTLTRPLDALRAVSRDLSFQQPLLLADGRHMTALDIQWFFLEHARNYLNSSGGSDEQWDMLEKWAETLNFLPDQWLKLATRLDWAIKKRLLDRYLQTQGVSWSEHLAWQPDIARSSLPGKTRDSALQRGLDWQEYEKHHAIYFALRRINLEYHDIRATPDQGGMGLFYQLQHAQAIEQLSTEEEIEQLISAPPPDTRAWQRGQIIKNFTKNIISADWSGLHLKLPEHEQSKDIFVSLINPLMVDE